MCGSHSFPPIPPCDWQTGFEDIMHMGAAVSAMNRGKFEVDGPEMENNK